MSTHVAVQPTRAELEAVIERGMFAENTIEVGDALAQVRDEKLYLPEYTSFRDWVEQRLGVARSVPYAYISGAEVLRDLSRYPDTAHIRLTVWFAELLYRFDSHTRRELAPTISSLSYEKARKLVKARSAADQQQQLPKRPEHVPDPLVVAVGMATKTLVELPLRDTKQAVDRLDHDSWRKLYEQIALAQRRLHQLATPDPARALG
jgi:hypothetical protein